MGEKATCAACDMILGFANKCRLKDGVVCKVCYEKAGLNAEKMPPHVVEVWEVCALHEMCEEDKKAYIGQKRYDMSKDSQTAYVRPAAVSPPLSPTCPKCGSTSITADKKGFGVGKAVIGAAVAGPIGLIGGNIGAKKVRVTCLNCGHQWMAGKAK